MPIVRRLALLAVALAVAVSACGTGANGNTTIPPPPEMTTTAAAIAVSLTTPPPSTTGPESSVPSTPCETTTLLHRVTVAGTAETCELESDGIMRSYLRYIPPGVDSGVPVPLLVSLHPAFQDPKRQMTWFPFDELADEEAFIVVAPEAVDGFWNFDVTPEQYCDYMQVSSDCGMIDPTTGEPAEPPDPACTFEDEGDGEGLPDDVAFLEDLVEAIAQDYSIDRQRVYLAGGSWGGWMASTVACVPDHPFAAIAGMTNTMWYLEDCAAPEPVPFISVGGSDDMYHPSCMADVYAERWAEHNGCDLTPVDGVDPAGVTRLEYAACEDDASVITYHMPDLWLYPDMTVPSGFAPLRVIWEFFEAHPRR